VINRVVLVGRLTKDPELRHTTNNVAVATFRLAVNRPFKSQDGDADFLNCVVWRKQAENVERFLSKGSLVGVEGRVQSRNYEDRDGNRRSIVEIVCESVQFLESRDMAQNTSRYNDEPRRESRYDDRSASNYEDRSRSNRYEETPNNRHESNHDEEDATNDKDAMPDVVTEDDLPF